MSIRCFIAIELDKTITPKLAELQNRLRKKIKNDEKNLKWIRAEDIHLTLKFLGDVPDNLTGMICTAVSDAVTEYEPFEIEIGNCGCFPSRGSARVLWTGITQGQIELQTIQETVDLYLQELNFDPEQRKFHPHLTLARIKNFQTGRKAQEIIAREEPFTVGFQQVEKITVFQSELTRSGPIYTALGHSDLKQ